MRETLHAYCIRTGRVDLLHQWDSERNGAETPQTVSYGSKKKVWWRCASGHSYAAVISARVLRDSGCPYCAGKKVLQGFNDLAAADPQVAAQWHPALNGMLTPTQVTYGSRQKVWWQCLEGHVWKAAIYSRTGTQKCGCPVCAGRFKAQRRHTGVPTPAKNGQTAGGRI